MANTTVENDPIVIRKNAEHHHFPRLTEMDFPPPIQIKVVAFTQILKQID